ncbi:MAG TPA: alpha/beta hydrolase [Alphaproteobacteria bacterium]|jgi:pimeloyl-ACP methyl ester carboxylesterase|nr:alpha/beta hydrolase [Alphaproteobacteria bacterium]
MAFLRTDHLHIFYADHGFGPNVLLLHSSGGSHRQWLTLIGDNAVNNRFLAPDLIGYGQTRDLSGRAFAPEREVELVLALLECAPGPIDIVGHSYGGVVALDAALALGPRVRSLTLIEPVAFHVLRTAGSPAWVEIAALARRHIAYVEEGDVEGAAEIFMGYWIGRNAWAAMPLPQKRAIVGGMAKIADEWRGMLAATTDATHYAGIAAPVRFLCSARMTPAVRAATDLLQAILPGADRVTLEGGGHLAPITHPALVNTRIMAHIADARARHGALSGAA